MIAPSQPLFSETIISREFSNDRIRPIPAKSLEALIDGSRIGGFQIRVIIICALVAVIDGFDTQAMSFAAPDIGRAWHVAAPRFGLVFGAGLFGGLLGGLALGPASDRFGRKPLLLACVLLFGVMSGATTLVTSIPQLIALRILAGIGLGGALPSIISMTSEYVPQRVRPTMITWMFCGFPLGATIGGAISAKLIPIYGWRIVFAAGGVIPLILLPILWLFLPESIRYLAARGAADKVARIVASMHMSQSWDGALEKPKGEQRSPVAALFRDHRGPGTLLIWTTLFMSLVVAYLMINWIPMVARLSGFGPEASVLGVAALNLGTIAGCIVLGRLASSYRPATVIAVAYALGALAIASIGMAGRSTPIFLGATFAAGFLSTGAQLCMIALGAAFYETHLRATGVGWSMGVARVGGILGPMIGGVLLGLGIGAAALYSLTGAISLIAGVSALVLGRIIVAKARKEAPATVA